MIISEKLCKGVISPASRLLGNSFPRIRLPVSTERKENVSASTSDTEGKPHVPEQTNVTESVLPVIAMGKQICEMSVLHVSFRGPMRRRSRC